MRDNRARMTAAEYQAYLAKRKPRTNKYGAKRATSDMFPELAGMTFPSKLERDRAQELVILQRAGQIAALQFHPYVLLVNSTIGYHPDSVYLEKGEEIYEEVKGIEGKRWKLIKQLWAKHGPGPLRVVKRGAGGRLCVVEEIRP